MSIYGARTCGLCRACREKRDNLCENVGGVHGFHLDGFAQEKINIPARLLVPAPPGVDAIGAAVTPVTFGTVEHMLFDNARLEPGETILVHAGGSGIGSAAIQLAKRIGCTVITTVGSADKIDKAKALGADHVINYREDRFEGVVRKLTKKKGVDVVFEHVGADTWAGSMLSLKRGGRLVTCGSTSGVSTQMNLMQLFQQQLRLIGSFGCRMENMANAHAEDGGRPCRAGDRHRGRLRRDRHGAEAHGKPRRVRQDHPQGRLTRRCIGTAEPAHRSCLHVMFVARRHGCGWPTIG